MTLIVHPAFDTEARVWFTDDGVEAKSLAELQRKLPRTKIAGYYPNGFGLKVQVKTIPPKPVVLTPLVTPLVEKRVQRVQQPQLPLESRTPSGGARLRYRGQQEPTTWAEDEPIKELPPVRFTARKPVVTELPGIAPKFVKEEADEAPPRVPDPPEPLPVLPVEVHQADPVEHREVVSAPKGKARHPTRTDHRVGGGEVRPWTEQDDTRLKYMVVVQKLSDSQIAKELGRTNNSIIGRRHRKKLFRDPRD